MELLSIPCGPRLLSDSHHRCSEAASPFYAYLEAAAPPSSEMRLEEGQVRKQSFAGCQDQGGGLEEYCRMHLQCGRMHTWMKMRWQHRGVKKTSVRSDTPNQS